MFHVRIFLQASVSKAFGCHCNCNLRKSVKVEMALLCRQQRQNQSLEGTRFSLVDHFHVHMWFMVCFMKLFHDCVTFDSFVYRFVFHFLHKCNHFDLSREPERTLESQQRPWRIVKVRRSHALEEPGRHKYIHIYLSTYIHLYIYT